MEGTFESGCQKRKKKQQLGEQLKKLPKVDSYFIIGMTPHTQDSQPGLHKPQPSTTSIRIDYTDCGYYT